MSRKTMTLPWHRLDCDCTRCEEEEAAFQTALDKAGKDSDRAGRRRTLGKKFVAGFALGWRASREHVWKSEGETEYYAIDCVSCGAKAGEACKPDCVDSSDID